jgi:16S rRNA (guanine527-N7)-methyltransferase
MISKMRSISIIFNMAHKNRTNWSPYSARRNGPGASGADGRADASGADGRADASGANAPADARGADGRPGAKPAVPARPFAPAGARHRQPQESFTLEQADDRIYDVFRHHGFADISHETRRKLSEFFLLLMSCQREQNFTRLTSVREVAIKHFIDCLMPARLTELRYPLLDIGTGPGFPGIPLKILRPGARIGLAEGVQKRVAFLKSAREALGLSDLPIFGRNVNRDFHYPFAGVITRAVEDARNTLGNAINCLPIGGRAYLMKGPNCLPEIPMALKEWGPYYRLAGNIAYSLPETPHERRLLIFEKIAHLDLPESLADYECGDSEALGASEPDDAEESAFLRKARRLLDASRTDVGQAKGADS